MMDCGVTQALWQAIFRQLGERIIITVHSETEQFDVQVHGIGGEGTQIRLLRPAARLDQLSYYPQLMARLALQALRQPSSCANSSDCARSFQTLRKFVHHPIHCLPHYDPSQAAHVRPESFGPPTFRSEPLYSIS